MIKEGIINYKLYINEDGADGVAFDNTIEAGLTALLITAESLHQQLESAKNLKAECKNAKQKDDLNKSIMLYKRGLSAVNKLARVLCANYEEYIMVMGAAEMIAKDEQSLQDSKENKPE